jgi:hypothetical protein
MVHAKPKILFSTWGRDLALVNSKRLSILPYHLTSLIATHKNKVKSKISRFPSIATRLQQNGTFQPSVD